MSSTPMTSGPMARHWQWLSLRLRRTRRGLPSVLVIIFLLALTSIFFFPDLDVSAFAPRVISGDGGGAGGGGKELLLQDQTDPDHGQGWTSPKEPPLVEPEPEVEVEARPADEIPEGGGGGGRGVPADDPLIASIADLRTKLTEHYTVDYWRSARGENDAALERLSTCMQDGTCGPGEKTVVLLATFHFGHAKLGMVSGEDIWARSSLEAFTALNYTLLYTYGHMDTLLIYQHIPDLVNVIIWEGEQLRRCMARNETYWQATEFDGDEMRHSPGTWQDDLPKGCIKTDRYPSGIPISKSFWFHFWPTAPHPLGEKWTLAPYDYMAQSGKENFHLGYSIESGCEKIPYIPQDKKQHRAIVLGKRPDYFAPGKLAWPDMLPAVAASITPITTSRPDEDEQQTTGFSFVGAYTKNQDSEVIAQQGIETLGKLSMDGWFEAVGSSKVMLGIGEPWLSPSPFDALCQGVPFINVVRHWDKTNPEDRTKWRTQHDPLLALGPPYVYHVRKEEQESLETAIQAAINNPIDRYILPSMTRQSVLDKHRNFVETDWTKLGRARIEIELEDEDHPFPYAP